MKFLHIGDLHIGKHLCHYSLLDDQKYVLEQIIRAVAEEKPEAVVIAGDIYDKPIPSAEAVCLLDWFLTELNSSTPAPEILMIAGNHDSGERLGFASEILKKHRVHIAGMPPREAEEKIQQVVLEDAYGKVHFYLLPFTKPSYIKHQYAEGEIGSYDSAIRALLEKEEIDSGERNVIVSHQFYTAGKEEEQTCDSEILMVGGIDRVYSDKLDVFDYAALGHLHKAQKVGRKECRYAGTLLKYSVSEAEDKKTFTIVELKEKGSRPQIETRTVKPLRDVSVLQGELQEVLTHEEEAENYVSITLTDEVEPYLPKERLETVFSHILEIRIDNARTRKILELEEEQIESEAPMESFAAFFEIMQGRTMTSQEEKVMQEILNQLLENGGERD